MTRQFISEVSLLGIVLDALGGLYLAYDLLGGKRGPLRMLMRAVTYSVLQGSGYGLAFGLRFGVVTGIGLGTSVALESTIVSGSLTRPTVRSLFFAAFRGVSIGAGAALTFGPPFGLRFGLLSFIGLLTLYLSGLTPMRIFSAIGKPKLTREGLLLSVSRAGVIGTAAILAGLLLKDRTQAQALEFGLRVGLVVGLMLIMFAAISPFIEWWVDSLPERKLGAFGVLLIIAGFLLQTVQYLVVILHIPIWV